MHANAALGVASLRASLSRNASPPRPISWDLIPLVPINHTGVNNSISCLNFLPRTGLGVDAIGLSTINDDVDSFALGGNKVSFDEDPNVRGRLGLRVGTSTAVWAGTTMEPFVIGSLWGDLSGDRQPPWSRPAAPFISRLTHKMWGEVSAGVNFFNPSANTSVFAKLDVTFGDNIEDFGGKAGMRVSW